MPFEIVLATCQPPASRGDGDPPGTCRASRISGDIVEKYGCAGRSRRTASQPAQDKIPTCPGGQPPCTRTTLTGSILRQRRNEASSVRRRGPCEGLDRRDRGDRAGAIAKPQPASVRAQACRRDARRARRLRQHSGFSDPHQGGHHPGSGRCGHWLRDDGSTPPTHRQRSAGQLVSRALCH